MKSLLREILHITSYLVSSWALFVLFFGGISQSAPFAWLCVNGSISAINTIGSYFLRKKDNEKFPFLYSLFVTIFALVVIFTTVYSRTLLENFLKETNIAIQKACCEKELCPNELQGWDKPHPNSSYKEFSTLFYSYNVQYVIQDSMKEYSLGVKYGFDHFREPINGSVSNCSN